MYGRTNKRDATKQIGQHVRRLERAQLAADHQRMKTWSEIEGVGGGDDHDIGQDLETHHHISKSRKEAVDIFDYVYKNCGDPAFNVRLCLTQLETIHHLSDASIGLHP